MRPINLIPPESRRGASAPMRTGPLPYLVLGALALVLAGVTLLVLAGNTVSDREAEVAHLEREDGRASAKAQRLAAFTQFREMQRARTETITSLADSRFDWERVMRELSLILPQNVWLVGLDATASPEASTGESSDGGGGSDSGLRSAAFGPALEIEGCASGQEAVAGFVTALKDIDGVTRVGVQSSELSADAEGAGASGGSGDNDCRTRDFIAMFEVVVAFDAAPVAPSASAEAAAVAPVETTETAAPETSEGE